MALLANNSHYRDHEQNLQHRFLKLLPFYNAVIHRQITPHHIYYDKVKIQQQQLDQHQPPPVRLFSDESLKAHHPPGLRYQSLIPA